MKMTHFLMVCLVACVARPTCCLSGEAKSFPQGEANAQASGAGRPHARTDDLSWLVGKWHCVSNTWVDQSRKLGGDDEHLLEWFNVYFPYADDNLTLELTDNPDDRPIAAEFLIRPDLGSPYHRDGITPMPPTSVVRISTNRIRVGGMFDLVEFKYCRLQSAAAPRLELESKFVRLVLEKTSDTPGQIQKSWVDAPIRRYEQDQIDALRLRYDELRRDPEKRARQ
jgi:hypothetical protein